ncbi:phosphate ABC transporter permease [Aphanothece hegewaldii CCALA 016]|uniref:Transport permease protein n=1 Tax=Aphanothece hegewaldii CCALA 016 TaxID=2107694 RepID=A0A2T1LX37_9CHRO|nr:ABC transporter permease [Aphanothece hegewaldii]PSF36735.1 phosphate ABC transporter permease [Aphanothece hegewaldii CCALA 016]
MKQEQPLTIIQADQGWLPLNIDEIWAYRDLLYLLVWRDIRSRYRQMALGPLWIVLQPLMTIAIFSVVFGGFAKIPSDGIPYPIFAYAALLPWQLFATATVKASDSLVNNVHLISKVYFPRIIVPIAAVLVSLADFAASFGVLLLMMLFYRIYPTFAVITLPLYILLAMGTAWGVGLWLASLSVKFRDVAIAVTYLVQIWFYATAVIYPTSIVPEKWRNLFLLNPMTQVVEGFRWALLGNGQPPNIISLLAVILVIVLLISGAFYFRQTEGSIVDEI